VILVDTFEPTNIEELVQQSVPTFRDSLNAKGLPDYTWVAVDAHSIGLSRKQAGELLSSLDDAEEQLSRDMVGVDEMTLLVENIFGPVDGDKCQIYAPSKDERFLIPRRKYHTSYCRVYAWFSRLDKCGITVVQTFNWEATAKVLVALYQNSQNMKHTTLNRYIKKKITPKKLDSQVKTLMGISGANLGEVKATALVDEFGTVWNILHTPIEELIRVDGIGTYTIRELFKAIGKE